MTTIFLHVGVTSFPDPGDWNPFDSFVDCVGAGGAGSVGNISTLPAGWLQRVLGGSGGGGTYARGQNLTLTFPVPVSIAAANTGGMTWFNGTTNTAPNVYAPSGGNASGSSVGAGGAIGYPVSRAGGSASAALISNNQPNNQALVYYGRAGGAGGAGGINGNGRFGSQYYNADGIGWAASTGPSYGGAPNATSQNQTPFPLDQPLISGAGTTDLSIWGDAVEGLGGGGNGGGDVPTSPPASPQPGMSYFDGTTLYIWSNASPGPGWFAGGTNQGSLNGGNGGLYGGGGGGASLLYDGTSGAPGNGADGVIAIIYTPYVPLPPGEPPPGWVREYLDTTSGQQYWPDPGNWDPNNNKIECVGAGGAGAGPTISNQPPDTGDPYGGGGGGGGAYAYATNVPLTFPVPYWIPTGANTALAVNFNVLGNVPSTSPGAISAGCGITGSNGFGTTTGSGGLTHFPNGFVGGNGGFTRITGTSTGGGGGAAGPDGAGGNGTGQTGTPIAQGGVGGNSDGGTISPGQSGQQWGVGRGTGGGGSGAVNATGTPGAAYGGGGAGGAPNTGAGAAAGAGMIILTWKPLVRPQGSSRFVVAG